MSWGDLARELMTPSNYKSAYIELINQIGHMYLGIYMVCLLCVSYLFLFTEMPYRPYVASLILVVYLLVEVKQNWKLGDSEVDATFVMIGALTPLLSLRELAIPDFWYLIDLQLDARYLIAMMGVSLVALVARIKGRL